MQGSVACRYASLWWLLMRNRLGGGLVVDKYHGLGRGHTRSLVALSATSTEAVVRLWLSTLSCTSQLCHLYEESLSAQYKPLFLKQN